MKKYILFFYLFFTISLLMKINIFASKQESSSIPDDAVEFENHYYKLYELNILWDDAQEYFKSINGHLATITSQKENDFIYNYITSLGYQSAYFGATDKDNEGTWMWVTGEEFDYSNWHKNEPNNEQNSENYAMFYYKYKDGTWNDGGAHTINANLSKTPYICEWDNIMQNDSDNSDSQNQHASELDKTVQNENTDLSNSNEKVNNKKTVIEIHIDNLFTLGGFSIFGGFSLLVLKIKKHRND